MPTFMGLAEARIVQLVTVDSSLLVGESTQQSFTGLLGIPAAWGVVKSTF